MSKAKSSLRIKGLVRLMNHVRECKRDGIPPDKVADFRSMVSSGISQVEKICRDNHTSPDALPAPSRRAYYYLKELDLKKLPLQKGTRSLTQRKKIQISGLMAISNHYHAQFSQMCAQVSKPWRATDPQVVKLASELSSYVDTVVSECRKSDAQPADLPIKSRRAYQWLSFLCAPDVLALHLNAVASASKIAAKAPVAAKLASKKHRVPVRVNFYVFSASYRIKVRAHEIELVLNEGFVGASDAVLRALVRGALQMQLAADSDAYAASTDFAEIMATLERFTAAQLSVTRGLHHNLEESFARVNAEYFDAQLPKPNLKWNDVLTYRKMGHYHALSDTLMVSITLDDARVPVYVVDFVVYHELLHKKIGVTITHGRHYAHTAEFRAAEVEFRRYAEAQIFLSELVKL